MVRELEGVFKGKRYSFAEHWDQVIIGYRECERSLFKFSPKNQHTIKRLTGAIVHLPLHKPHARHTGHTHPPTRHTRTLTTVSGFRGEALPSRARSRHPRGKTRPSFRFS